MTQILNLPLYGFSVSTGTNESWTDSWAYLDAAGNPISGAGITLGMMVRRSGEDREAQIVASSLSDPLDALPLNGRLSFGGTGLNVITLAIPETTMERISPGCYTGEVQAYAEGYAKTIALIAVTIRQGVVR